MKYIIQEERTGKNVFWFAYHIADGTTWVVGGSCSSKSADDCEEKLRNLLATTKTVVREIEL